MSELLELPTCNCHTKPNQVCSICQIWVPYVNKQQSQLRTLAEAVLEAHQNQCDYCPLVDRSEIECMGVMADSNCCQCPACQLAREIVGGGE